ncbi:diuretic hormone class 2 isoform X3 [Pararge aegeria]|uniref:diuretic hormone class 2 isoform X3 n=1 Tax=Pararge aegeria TaxID=116150 RepID=UPI0019D1D3AD|nr:diuretic hormone class 2 isoform X3 [Pararge aegeria]
MMRFNCLMTCCLLGALLLVLPATAFPSPNNYYRDDGQYDPEEIMGMLNRLNEIIQMERRLETYKEDISRTLMSATNGIPNEKRDLDMGLNRGFSGAVQAKHLIGMAASRFAGGPGRRRRDAH